MLTRSIVQVGNERYNFFTGCARARACTILLRGGAEQFIDETERSLHDALMIVRRARTQDAVVAGGGAIDMELSRTLRDFARTIAGKQQLLIAAFARAFEVCIHWRCACRAHCSQVIPQQLCYNAGLDATDMLNRLRHRHAKGELWVGVNVQQETLCDNMQACVWEPAIVKRQVNARSFVAIKSLHRRSWQQPRQRV
jgi:T-complex protein 1 subunit eta